MNENFRSQWGEGTGVPMSNCADPNKPSFDPAASPSDRLKSINQLVHNHWSDLNEWEHNFILSILSLTTPLTRRQAIVLRKLIQRFKGTEVNEDGQPEGA